ncbi:MAG: methionyl-tRNA formyltransferase [Planctomycetota bacterium]|nr:methionyl-tRNA formyltransferase [Planctomycetota bacterium]MDA1201358.1 methionyl-tRNA formyltransferase [Planctomycetota bacterium]
MPGLRPLRLVVMGTGPFAVPMFRALIASPHEVVAVVTRPDHAPPGRRPPPNPMRKAATAAGLPVLDPERANAPESVAAIRELAADLFVVCDYGQLLSAELLAVPPLGGINLHGSLLPRHRGAAPIQWAILEGDPLTGVSVIGMTPRLDAGRVITARETPIGPRETAAELEERLAEIGSQAVLDAIERLEATVAAGHDSAEVGIPQDEATATRAPRLSKTDGVVDWSQPAAVIERMRRAFDPWPRAVTFFERADGDRQRLVLTAVEVASPEEFPAPAAVPGTVIATEPAPDPGRIVVASGGGTAVSLTRLVPEGKRAMTAAEFLRGSPLRPGSRLG